MTIRNWTPPLLDPAGLVELRLELAGLCVQVELATVVFSVSVSGSLEE